VLWNEYNKFCTDNDFTEMSKIKFKQELEKDYAITETYIVKDRSREVVFKGIAFSDINNPEKPESKKVETIATSVTAFTEE
jgi:hypothetical protein